MHIGIEDLRFRTGTLGRQPTANMALRKSLTFAVRSVLGAAPSNRFVGTERIAELGVLLTTAKAQGRVGAIMSSNSTVRF
jgi:hypothetical protein